MVYIRSKSVKGDKYLYLVKSIWDSKKHTSKQEIIKYLGKATQVKTEDIPRFNQMVRDLQADVIIIKEEDDGD